MGNLQARSHKEQIVTGKEVAGLNPQVLSCRWNLQDNKIQQRRFAYGREEKHAKQKRKRRSRDAAAAKKKPHRRIGKNEPSIRNL